MTAPDELAERRARLLGPCEELDDPQLKSQVASTLGRLSSAFDDFTPAQATWAPEGEWSAAQICDHIVLGTGLLGNIAEVLAGGRRPDDADWDPPPQFKGDPADLDDIRARLAALPAEAEGLFDRCIATNRTDVTAENSFLGEMNWRQWFYFLRIHALDHLQQMEKLRSSAGFPS